VFTHIGLNYQNPTNETESESLYDWRFTSNQFVLARNFLSLTTKKLFFQLDPCRHCPYVTFSLTRGWASRLQFLLFLGSSFSGTHEHILLPKIRDSPQPRSSRPRNYIPQQQSGPVYPQALGSLFVASYD
jgi:hypothetical protein